MNHLASSLTSEHLPTLDGLRRAGLNDLAQLMPKDCTAAAVSGTRTEKLWSSTVALSSHSPTWLLKGPDLLDVTDSGA